MKKIILFMLITSLTYSAIGQEIAKSEIDEFTNEEVKMTSWESLNMDFKFTAYFRIIKISDERFLELKMMIGSSPKVFSINKDQEFMFKLANKEIIKLHSQANEITCTGCGAIGFSGSSAQGIKASYSLTKGQAEELVNNNVLKIRIYTSDGYVEKDFKSKYYKKLRKALLLIH